jgi:hypothetical protein
MGFGTRKLCNVLKEKTMLKRKAVYASGMSAESTSMSTDELSRLANVVVVLGK